MQKVLLVEDNAGFARLLKEILAEAGVRNMEFEHADRLESAVDRLDQEDYDVMLLDLSLPDSRGLNTVVSARAAAPRTPIVVLTATDDNVLGAEAVRHGAQDYLVKSDITGRTLARSMCYSVERKRLQDEQERLIGELQQALARVKRLSGLLPICSSCKMVREDSGYWRQVEEYINEHSEASVRQSLCPSCARKMYPDLFDGL